MSLCFISVNMSLSLSLLGQMIKFHDMYMWIVLYCAYVTHFLCPFNHWQTLRLNLCPLYLHFHMTFSSVSASILSLLSHLSIIVIRLQTHLQCIIISAWDIWLNPICKDSTIKLFHIHNHFEIEAGYVFWKPLFKPTKLAFPYILFFDLDPKRHR